LLFPFFLTRHTLEKRDWRKDTDNLQKGEFVIFAPVPYGPFENVAQPYSKPSINHILGTDKIGRDVFSRMLYGARVSLAVGVMATLIAIAFGTLIGIYSGYYGGKFDFITMRIVEIVICFPTFLLLLILMAIMQDIHFSQSILLVIAVIGLTSWTGLSRIVRGETLKLRSMPYIQCCEALALPKWRVMLFHILPNVIGPIMISFSFGVAGAIIAESSLSFLGFGVQAPTASWGELLRQALEDPFSYWHLTLWPGIALFIAVVSFNFAGEGLRKALDPKS
jgi:peptide/nickel transport system permease protein